MIDSIDARSAKQVAKPDAKPASQGVVRPLKVELSSEVVHALQNPLRPASPSPTKAASKNISKPVSPPPTNLGAKLAATVAKPTTQAASPSRSLTWASASIGGPVGASASGEVKEGNALGRGVGFIREQHSNFQGGTVDWAKSNTDPLLHMVQHPIESARAADQLANNVMINPAGAFMRGALQGKTPLEVVREDVREMNAVGQSTVSDYQKEYERNGVAGVAGYVLPDIAIAILTAGEGNGARVTGKQVLAEVAKSRLPVTGPSDLPGVIDSARQT